MTISTLILLENIAMKNLFLILMLIGFVRCEEPPRDVSHCTEKPTECDQYSCYFPSCDCLSNNDAEAPFAPRFSANKVVSSEAIAKEIGLAYMEKIGDTAATVNQVGEEGYGWYFVTFSDVQDTDNEHIVISPKGNVYLIGCGV